jgi:DNA polymerase-3 subunit epsilon
MKFIAIDVETANPDMSSICAIGAATFEDGQLTSEFYILVDPKDWFCEVNVDIHGITERMVSGAPTYGALSATLNELCQNTVVVAHTHFDRTAFRQAAQRWGVAPPSCTWLDSARVARRTWADCARAGYGLAPLCERIGYKFQHHHALEDAKAGAQVLLAAMAETGLDLEGMMRRVELPIGCPTGSVRRTGNQEGPLCGEVVVFTGALEITRAQAADLVSKLGCDVGTGVTKKTTVLIVGDSDVAQFAGHDKSAKHRKAEELISQGVPIRILRETDFQGMVALMAHA